MEDAGASFLITTPELKAKINSILPKIQTLQKVIVINKLNRSEIEPDNLTLSYDDLMKSIDPNSFVLEPTTQYDFSIMHYTSGSTGKPKGVLHRHQAVIQQWLTGKWALDLKEKDIHHSCLFL